MGHLRLNLHPVKERHVLLEVNGVEVWVTLDAVSHSGEVRALFIAPPEVRIRRGRLLQKMGRACAPPPPPTREEFYDGESPGEVPPPRAV